MYFFLISSYQSWNSREDSRCKFFLLQYSFKDTYSLAEISFNNLLNFQSTNNLTIKWLGDGMSRDLCFYPTSVDLYAKDHALHCIDSLCFRVLPVTLYADEFTFNTFIKSFVDLCLTYPFSLYLQIPRDILLEILGYSKVYRQVIKKLINSTIADYVKKVCNKLRLLSRISSGGDILNQINRILVLKLSNRCLVPEFSW